jgi:estrone sulfotransferase
MSQAEDRNATDNSSGTISSESQADADLIIYKLPSREAWSERMVLFNNYWFHPSFAKSILHVQDSFKPRPEDTILATNPKCGTTWLKALAFAITKRSQYDFANHPLLSRHPHEVVPFIEIPREAGDYSFVETLPCPRLLATHIPLSLLPTSIAECGCRVVYICRDPKDAFVSRWCFDSKVIHKKHSMDLETMFNMFCEGFSAYGPFWDHCLEFWRESIARPKKVLFLKYEEMLSNPVIFVIKIAAFIGVPFSAKEEEDGVPEAIVRLCSFDKLSNLHVNKTGEFYRHGNLVIENSAYFRKGKVGDWVNHMSEEMGRKLDCWYGA